MTSFENTDLVESSLEERLQALRRANKNLGPQDAPETRDQLQALIAAVEQKLESRASPAGGGRRYWRPYLESLRERLGTQAKIFSDVTVTGRELPGVSGVLPEAARFLAARHKVYDSFFHSKSSVAATFKVETLSDLIEVICERPRVAILGEPGAGKSTTMVALAYALAETALRAVEEGRPAENIPIFVELGGMCGQGVESYIAQLVGAFGNPIEPDTLRNGETTLLLDGLNEASPQDAADVRRWLEANPSAHVVVSCRTVDYVDRDLPLRRVEIQPLDPGQVYGQIRKFLAKRDGDRLFWALAGTEAQNCWRWYNRNYSSPSFDDFWFGDVGPTYAYEVEKVRLASLQVAAKSGAGVPGMLAVVSNPMLLSAAMILFLRNSSVPARKDQLIEEVALSLLERVDTLSIVGDRDVRGGGRSVDEAVRGVVSTVAYRMIAETRGTGVPATWVREIVEELATPVASDALVFELERAGVIESYGGPKRIIKFRHQLIQEYFASVLLEGEIAEGLAPEDFWEVIPQRMPSGWDEVVLLLASRSEAVDGLIEWIAAGNPSLAIRAADAASDRCTAELVERLLRGDVGVAACPIGRARWWRREAHRDRRVGVRCRPDGFPDLAWCQVPAGIVHMGDPLVPDELGVSVTGKVEVDIPYSYAMTRYQITRSQYASFVKEAYGERTYWSELGFTWKGTQREPRFWNDPDFGGVENQPVVGVTWFEADAFARWIQHLLRNEPNLRPEWMVGDWEVSLPLVCEWEHAARYPDGRRFPWGDLYLAGNANIDERFEGCVVGPYFLQRPTPVGIYDEGVSVLGLHDMCGNVWEWCASKWVPGYRFPEHVAADAVDHRAVRGGSWYNSVVYGACGCHDCHDMDLGVNDIGFRLVARPVGQSPDLVD